MQKSIDERAEFLEIFSSFEGSDTGTHIRQVRHYSKFLAEKLELSYEMIEAIEKFSSLHDLGKMGVSEEILRKPGKLSPEEFEKIKTHVEIGHEIVKKYKLGKIAENIVYYHHERWDGEGYPGKLKGKEIPIEARVVSIADVYDALRQKRSYKDSYTHEEAVEIIKSGSGKNFDPKLIEIFLRYEKEFDEIYKKYINL